MGSPQYIQYVTVCTRCAIPCDAAPFCVALHFAESCYSLQLLLNVYAAAIPRSTALRSDPSSKTSVAVMALKHHPIPPYPTPHCNTYSTALHLAVLWLELLRVTEVDWCIRALIIAGVGGQCGHYEPPYSYWCAETTQGGGAAQYVVPSGALLDTAVLAYHSRYKSDLHSTMLSRSISYLPRSLASECTMHHVVLCTHSGCRTVI